MSKAPVTRQEWEAAWHLYPSRFLAWCKATKHYPAKGFDVTIYTTWLHQHLSTFRKNNNIAEHTTMTDEQSAAFTAWLWEHGKKVEA
jgi:hypothetical protein